MLPKPRVKRFTNQLKEGDQVIREPYKDVLIGHHLLDGFFYYYTDG